MNQQAIKKFKRRWKQINIFQDGELQKLSVQEKFFQLNSIMRLGAGMRLDFSEDKGKRNARARWIFLKEGYAHKINTA